MLPPRQRRTSLGRITPDWDSGRRARAASMCPFGSAPLWPGDTLSSHGSWIAKSLFGIRRALLDAVLRRTLVCLAILSAAGLAATSDFRLGLNYTEWGPYIGAGQQIAADSSGALYILSTCTGTLHPT